MKKIIITAALLIAAFALSSCEKEEPIATYEYTTITMTKGNGNGNGRGQNNGRGGEHANPNARGNGVTSQRGEGPAFGMRVITLTTETSPLMEGGVIGDNPGNGNIEGLINGRTLYM